MAILKGVDVSNHRGFIDWQKAKASGVQFAIIRGGYGSNILNEETTAITDDYEQDDPQFENNVRGCEANDIPWGMYLYSYACNLDQANSEVDHMIRLLKNKRPLYPVVLDMEDSDGYKAKHNVSKQMWNDIVYEELTKLESAGYYAMLYSSKNDRENILTDPRLDRFDLMLALWNNQDTYAKQHGIWQYADNGSVVGINGRCDMDKTTDYRDYPEYIKSNKLNGWNSTSTDNQPTSSSTPTTKQAPTFGEQMGPNPTLVWDFQWDKMIKDLQQILNNKGNSLVVDGIAGDNTYNVVNKCTINNGDAGPLTKWVQQRLTSVGCPCGTIDGKAGDKTMSAIKSFQQYYKLGEGYLGGTDWYYMIR